MVDAFGNVLAQTGHAFDRGIVGVWVEADQNNVLTRVHLDPDPDYTNATAEIAVPHVDGTWYIYICYKQMQTIIPMTMEYSLDESYIIEFEPSDDAPSDASSDDASSDDAPSDD